MICCIWPTYGKLVFTFLKLNIACRKPNKEKIGKDKKKFDQFLQINQSFLCKKSKKKFLHQVSYSLSKNLDTIFEDPKMIIVENNLAFSHNIYCVKFNFITYLFMKYLSNMQVAWLHKISLAFSSKTCISRFLTKQKTYQP